MDFALVGMVDREKRRRKKKLSEEIIAMLSNLGAIDETKAVSVDLLKNSEVLRDRILDEEIAKLLNYGYVKKSDGRLYLTRTGLLRALSRFS